MESNIVYVPSVIIITDLLSLLERRRREKGVLSSTDCSENYPLFAAYRVPVDGCITDNLQTRFELPQDAPNAAVNRAHSLALSEQQDPVSIGA